MYPGRGTRIFVKTWRSGPAQPTVRVGKRSAGTPEADGTFPDTHGATRTAPWHRAETRFPPITSPVLFVVKGLARLGGPRVWNRFPHPPALA